MEQGIYLNNDINGIHTVKNRLLLFYLTEQQFIRNNDHLGGRHIIILKYRYQK